MSEDVSINLSFKEFYEFDQERQEEVESFDGRTRGKVDMPQFGAGFKERKSLLEISIHNRVPSCISNAIGMRGSGSACISVASSIP